MPRNSSRVTESTAEARRFAAPRFSVSVPGPVILAGPSAGVLNDSASPAGPARVSGVGAGGAGASANRRRADGIRGGSGGRAGAARRRLGGQAERREEPP